MALQFARFSAQEAATVAEIVDRARALFQRFGVEKSRLELTMDLAAVHAKVPLRLKELAEADDANFSHDIGGIVKYLDRETGELTECFLPRYSKPRAEPVNN